MKNAKSRKSRNVEFQLVAETGSTVLLAGTFNNWDPQANPMTDNSDSGRHTATLRLPPGRHEYKFVVNGEWRVDPNCPDWVLNDQGSLNSVITV